MTNKLFQTSTRFAALLIFTFSLFTIYSIPDIAAISQNVLIKRVLLAGSGTNTTDQEYIELYNNSDSDVDVTDWCVQYNQANLSCIYNSSPQSRVFVTARRSILVMNPSFQTLLQTFNGNYKADIVFNGGGNQLAVSSGSIRVINHQGGVVDTLGWVNGAAETNPVSTVTSAGKALQRRVSAPGIFIDTDNNNVDFDIVTEDLSFSRGGLYESSLIIDQCLNTPDITEEFVPINFIRDSSGNCYEDVCLNIPELQIMIPNGYLQESNICSPIALRITELLPNVSGSDTGKEFVELHNPSVHQVNLLGYTLQLNPSGKKFIFTEPVIMQPGEYHILSDNQLGFVLPNTSGTVSLLMPDQTLLHETHEYLNPKDDNSWALINDIWQYTKSPSPSLLNALPVADILPTEEESIIIVSSSEVELASCGASKYRNPETNRCKAVETVATELTPCDTGQERNPETNRCRKITTISSVLTPCNADQERNPETNRCRKIGSTDDGLKPCAEGQERNTETNRCRKMETAVSGTVLAATAKPATIDPFRFKSQIIAVLIAALLGYGLYEYRSDIRSHIEKLKTQSFRSRPPK